MGNYVVLDSVRQQLTAAFLDPENQSLLMYSYYWNGDRTEKYMAWTYINFSVTTYSK